MKIHKYQKRFIQIFFVIKIVLLALTFFLAFGDVYTNSQMSDIRGIIFPTFFASIIIMLKFLRKNQGIKQEGEVSSTEVYIVFISCALYFMLVLTNLLQLNVSDASFSEMKSVFIWVESSFSLVFGWMISDFDKKQHAKDVSNDG